MTKSELTRFHESYTTTDECFIWHRGVDELGFATFIKDTGETVLAVAYIYPMYYGPIKGGQRLNHTEDCPNFRVCVNPFHLRPGKKDERKLAKELVEKDPDQYGLSLPRNARRFFTDDEVRDIRRLVAVGKTQQEIADKYRCKRMAICNVSTYRSYKHVR